MKLAIKTGLNDKIGGAVKESDPALVKDVFGNHGYSPACGEFVSGHYCRVDKRGSGGTWS